MIIAGDVGGTKTILALFELNEGCWVCYKKKQYLSADYKEFKDILNEFLVEEREINIQSVCIGVAGPIVDGDCITTNLPWVLKKQDIAEQTGAAYVKLLNDLESTAWGVLDLPEEDFVELNVNAIERKGHKAVLAAGTGLGEALVIWNDKQHYVVATEGGHTDFAPRNEMEIGLLKNLLKTYPDHVSYERVVCGQGLVDIYKYLKQISYAAVDLNVEQRMDKEDPAVVISEKKCKLCDKAMKLFCEIYGAEAGNLALKLLPKGGIVLAGGIAAKNLISMQQGDFMRGFLSKGRYKQALQEISIKVCLNEEAALLGAFAVAKLSL